VNWYIVMVCEARRYSLVTDVSRCSDVLVSGKASSQCTAADGGLGAPADSNSWYIEAIGSN